MTQVYFAFPASGTAKVARERQDAGMRKDQVGVVRSAVLIALALSIVGITRFLEEEDGEDAGDFGSFRRSSKDELGMVPDDLRPLVSDVERRIERISAAGRRRMRRHHTLVGLSATLTGGVPVAVAAGGPAWLTAALGSLAVLAQGLAQLAQNHRVGVEQHLLAVQMSAILRRFKNRLLLAADFEPQREVSDFLRALDDVEDASSARIGDVLARPTPLPPTDRPG